MPFHKLEAANKFVKEGGGWSRESCNPSGEDGYIGLNKKVSITTETPNRNPKPQTPTYTLNPKPKPQTPTVDPRVRHTPIAGVQVTSAQIDYLKPEGWAFGVGPGGFRVGPWALGLNWALGPGLGVLVT